MLSIEEGALNMSLESHEDVQKLEKLIGQLDGLHSEITLLMKKSPNDAVNGFKLKFINKVLFTANKILGDQYRPFDDFEQFDIDDVPSNSDVTMIINQYVENTERFRSDNVTYEDYSWVYWVNGAPSRYSASARRQVGKK